MDEPDVGRYSVPLEQHIDEVETRLGMLRDQILAMFGEGNATGEQSELIYSALRAMHALQLLRSEICEDVAQRAFGAGSMARIGLSENPPENLPMP